MFKPRQDKGTAVRLKSHPLVQSGERPVAMTYRDRNSQACKLLKASPGDLPHHVASPPVVKHVQTCAVGVGSGSAAVSSGSSNPAGTVSTLMRTARTSLRCA